MEKEENPAKFAFFQNHGCVGRLLACMNQSLAHGQLRNGEDNAIRSAIQPETNSSARVKRNTTISVESLEGRALLAAPGYPPTLPPMSPPIISPPPVTSPPPVVMPPSSSPTPVATPTKPTMPISSSPPKTPAPAKAPKGVGHEHAQSQHKPTGIVTKAPHFYQFYTGPKWAELNAVRASAELSREWHFHLHRNQSGRDQEGAGRLRMGN